MSSSPSPATPPPPETTPPPSSSAADPQAALPTSDHQNLVNGGQQMFPMVYPVHVPGLVSMQNPEENGNGAGLYAVPYHPFMGTMAGPFPSTLIPLRYNIPTTSSTGGVGEEQGQDASFLLGSIVSSPIFPTHSSHIFFLSITMVKDNRTFAATKINKLSDLLCADPRVQSVSDPDEDTATPATSPRYSSDSMSPFNPAASPYTKSPWIHSSAAVAPYPEGQPAALIGSLVREEGHVYSLAASGDLLYTGSESKNIRIWKRWNEFSGFKSSSGLVKAIVIAGGKIFTGHQDGKIRVWRVSPSDPTVHKRVGTLPRLKDFLKSSINPSNYVEVRRHRSAVWLRHFDAVSCLSLDEEGGILYSGSWDKTVKVWRIADLKCLESVTAHDDAINSVVAAGGGVLYTGSADGTVKQWRKELVGRQTKHVLVQTLLEQESAVTALAVSADGSIVYSGSSDGLVNWWRRGVEMVHGGVLRGHAMAVLCLATAGSLVITGSADKTLCVWRRDDGEVHTRISVLAGHGGPIKCLAVQEDRDAATGDEGWVVYSGSLDRSVKIWRVAERPQDSVVHMSPWNTPSPSPLHVRSALQLPGVPEESETKLGPSLRLRSVDKY